MMLVFKYECKSCGKDFTTYGDVDGKYEAITCFHCGNKTAYKRAPVFDLSVEGGCVNPGGG